MNIIQINDADKAQYMDLLLLADEHENMINKYLKRGKMYAYYQDDLKTIAVVTDEKNGTFEIKNIATIPQYQKMGYGKKMIDYLAATYKPLGTTLLVGTGDCPSTITFYQKCGFTYSHTLKNFFLDNYDHPMWDDGKQLTDMIYLKKTL